MNLKHVVTVAVGVCFLGAGPTGAGDTPKGERAGIPERARWQRPPEAGCATSGTPVTLASASLAATAGFEYASIQPGPVSRSIERNAEVAYNANRYARLSSRAPGVVAEVLKDLGEHVAAGEAVAVIDSTDLGAAKADLLLAIETANLWEANAARERALVEKGVGVEREALEAETRAAEGRIAVGRARQRLRNLGLSKALIDVVEKEGDTSSELHLVAPFEGVVVERSAVMGEVVEPTTVLLAVADTGRMWAMVDLIDSDLALVRRGQVVELTIDGLGAEPFAGTLTWISTQVDRQTRTIKARAEFDNPDGILRANMFGRASIEAGEGRTAILVPKESVQWEGCCNVAFVRDGEATYRPVRLLLGADAGTGYEVLDGLRGGETVVTRGSFILKNEILKSAVGAGCCEVDHLDK